MIDDLARDERYRRNQAKKQAEEEVWREVKSKKKAPNGIEKWCFSEGAQPSLMRVREQMRGRNRRK